eukprot:1157716-Pelagomonas_calceolata.AAC.1
MRDMGVGWRFLVERACCSAAYVCVCIQAPFTRHACSCIHACACTRFCACLHAPSVCQRQGRTKAEGGAEAEVHELRCTS